MRAKRSGDGGADAPWTGPRQEILREAANALEAQAAEIATLTEAEAERDAARSQLAGLRAQVEALPISYEDRYEGMPPFVNKLKVAYVALDAVLALLSHEEP